MKLPEPFGKYELLERIGTGGMAEVFLARTFGLAGFEKRLVVKRIRAEHAQDPRFVSLFIHEAKVGVHLNHPNIVATYELGKVGDSYYIAMEHLHGHDLNKVARVWRSREPGIEPSLAVGIMAEVCRGLAYAHGDGATGGRVGLVHRDVSPHNIFVTFAGEIKLVDFGIARLLSSPGAPRRPGPQAKPAGGKYAYMSPEQARGGTVDHRTDIYSAAVVLWELLAGRKLHPGGDLEAKLDAVRNPSIQRPGDHIDDELWRILARAMARDPAHRYPDAAELEEDLRAWLFDRHARADTAAVSQLMRETFPGEGEQDPATPDLRRLADDLGRLDPTEDASTTGATPPSTPGPKRPAPPPPRDEVLRPAADERKRVVVVVVDVDGFTDISARAEPEVLFKRHLQLLRWLRGVVDGHGGTIQRAHDDQIYLFFGAPKTRRDDLQRALACANDLQARTAELHELGIAVHFAIGMHTGDVTLTKGNAKRYMARGNTTRLARRLSEQADHGQTLVSEAIYRAAESGFDWQRGPWLLGRGGKSPKPSFLLSGRRTGTLPTPRGPWLRRGEELDVVRDALGEVSEGRGAAIVLFGDEGSGKTRLARELAAVAGRRRIPVYVGSAGPFGHRLRLLTELVRDVLEIDLARGPVDVESQVERLRPLGLFRRDLELLSALLSGDAHRADPEEVWTAATRLVRGLAADRPIVLILEDLHHLAIRSQGLVDRFVQRLADAPVLIVATWCGPESPPLTGARVVKLAAFDRSQARRLATGLLHCDAVSDALMDLIQTTCEGNPLYIEELLRYLHAEGRVVTEGDVAHLREDGALTLPDSVAGLIAARIDALDPAAKGALQLAAVMGETFSLGLLGEVVGVDDAFPLVSDLAAHGLVHPDDSADRWSFASAFVREAALRGILGVQRRDFHRLIADALERRPHSDRISWHESLAEHLGGGGRPLDAARHAYIAGQRLEDAQAFTAARDWFDRGLGWLAGAEASPASYEARIQGETMLRLRRGVTLLVLGEISAGLTDLQLALDIAADSSLGWLEAAAHLELARHHVSAGDARVAAAHLTEARAMARAERDTELERDVLEATAHLELSEGHTDRARTCWLDALERSEDDPRAAARALTGLANCHLRAGDLDAARPVLARALDAARVTGDKLLEGRILNNLGLLLAWRGESDEAVSHFRRALAVREELGYSRGAAVNHHNIGDVHFHRGEYARAHVSFSRSHELATEMGWPRGEAMNEVYLAFIDAAERDASDGPERLDAATAQAAALGDHEITVTGLWLRGRLQALRGQVDTAVATLDEALALASERDLQPLVRQIVITRAEVADGVPPSSSAGTIGAPAEE